MRFMPDILIVQEPLVVLDILINDPLIFSTSIGGGKFISVDGEGNYVICWSSAGGANYSKIFLQQLNRWGQKIGNNIQVSQNTEFSVTFRKYPQQKMATLLSPGTIVPDMDLVAV